MSKFKGNFPLSASQVRRELYRVRLDTQRLKSHHVDAFGKNHEITCRVCREHDCVLFGIDTAIRHFGGRP